MSNFIDKKLEEFDEKYFNSLEISKSRNEHRWHLKNFLRSSLTELQEKCVNYKIKSGKYKGYELGYTTGGQIFSREGFYLQKSTKSGNVKDIKYLEDCLKS